MIGSDAMNIVPMVTDSSSQATSPMSITAMFTDTKCYDLMPMSRKGIVFETSISFQLAFFSLIEHGILIFISSTALFFINFQNY